MKGGKFQRVGNSKEGNKGGNNIKSVVYVQHTLGSSLAKALREEEEIIENATGYKLKIVERAGDSLEGLLHKSNPWSGADCAREKCLLCETKNPPQV
jgi:hypothetical protein